MPVLWEDTTANVSIVRLTAPRDISSLVEMFETVASEEGWQPDGALRLWQAQSVYFGLKVDGKIVGGLQLVLTGSDGTLPCQQVWPEITLSGVARRNGHIAILALQADARGQSTLFWRLVVEMWRYCATEGISILFIEVTPRVLPLYRRLGWPLKVRGELRRHWGEDCYLCTLGIPEVAETLLRKAERSVFYLTVIAQAFRLANPVIVMTPVRRSMVREAAAIYAIR